MKPFIAVFACEMNGVVGSFRPRGMVRLTPCIGLGLLLLRGSSMFSLLNDAPFPWNLSSQNIKPLSLDILQVRTPMPTAQLPAMLNTPAINPTSPPPKTLRTVKATSTPTNPPTVPLPVVHRNMSVVLRTWHQDASMALIGLSTAVKQIGQQLLEIVVVTDDESAEVVQTKVVDPLVLAFPQLHDRKGIRLHVEPMLLRNGQIQQKYSQMTADTYTRGRFILHLDSDCIVTQWHDACFLENGKPINAYSTYKSLAPPSGMGAFVWKEGTEVLLGIPDEKYEFKRWNQHVYPRELYSKMRKRAEKVHGGRFVDIFQKLNMVGTMSDKQKFGMNSTLLISHFNTLGATAFHIAPHLMTQKHLDRKTPSYPICVAQCNAHLLGEECCKRFLNNQTLVAQSGTATHSHADCRRDFPVSDPCYCDKED